MIRHLIIFTRAAQLGRVKHRLAVDIGALSALRFHSEMQMRLVHGVGGDRRWKTWAAITPDIRTRNSLFSDMEIINQGSGDLGQRMAHCFRALPPGPAVLIGSDIPGITHQHIAGAFAQLGKNDVVFGPAEDGGYWLIGLKRLRPIGGPHGRNLFSGVRWSSPHALSDTIKAAGSQARIGFVDTLPDVDSAGDYYHWRRLCSSRRGMISTKLQGRKR